VAVRKKVPKKPLKLQKKRSPMHPIEHTQYIREDRVPTPLMEFIISLEGELEYLEAIREFQSEWCNHPKIQQTVSSTIYAPDAQRYEHILKCECCGLLRHRNGRGPSGRY